MTRARLWSAGAVLLAAVLTAPNALAQQQNPCRILCAPELLIEPTWTIENLALRPRVEHPDGTQEQVPRESVFELVLAVDVPTRLRRIGFTGEIILAPTRKDNAPELEFELNLDILQPEQTGGWVKSHFDVVDQFGPIERPDAGPSPYTAPAGLRARYGLCRAQADVVAVPAVNRSRRIARLPRDRAAASRRCDRRPAVSR